MSAIHDFFERVGKRIGKVIRTAAVPCHQWGDTGKGKIVDIIAEWADMTVRSTGGDNAGHTIVVNGKKIIVHLVPSGILRPDKINVIGSGVVLNPIQLAKEVKELQTHGVDCAGRLFIAENAKLILPQHTVIDRLRGIHAGKGKIGTTGRGIGPAYAHFYDRIGLFVNDMQNPDVFVERLRQNLRESVSLIRGYNLRAEFEEIMLNPDSGLLWFYSPIDGFDEDAIMESYLAAGREFRSMIIDTDEFVRSRVGKMNILMEGAQGLLLSIHDGTYPYVTSSDCSTQGMARGSGLRHGDIDFTLAVVKAFYMTRVGEGPFPTEFGGAKSEAWCGGGAEKLAKSSGCKSVEKMEAKQFALLQLDEQDEHNMGIAVRIAGNEYGATTGRPRRTGWLDLPLLRYAVQVTGNKDIALTKLDVLSECPDIKICTSYTYEGPEYRIGNVVLARGDTLNVAIPRADVLKHCRPVYTEFAGWMENIRDAKAEDDLPWGLRDMIRHVELHTDSHVSLLSVGPDREHTIFRD